MIQHTSPAATDSTRHQQLCNAIRMVHFHDRHCPRQGPFRQIYFPVTPKAEHLSPIRIGMRALRKLGKWPLKPKRVIGLSSYNSGVQNLSAKVGLYSSECSGLSVCQSYMIRLVVSKSTVYIQICFYVSAVVPRSSGLYVRRVFRFFRKSRPSTGNSVVYVTCWKTGLRVKVELLNAEILLYLTVNNNNNM